VKLHETLVQKLLKVYEVNSGWTEEKKLQGALRRLDMSVYTQQDGTQILVPTEELAKYVSQAAATEHGEKERRLALLVDEAKRANGEI